MSSKISFEMILYEMKKIFNLKNLSLVEKLELIDEFVEACGWSKEEFDQELLKHVDKDW